MHAPRERNLSSTGSSKKTTTETGFSPSKYLLNKMRPREDWNEEVEAHVAASIIVGLVSGALKFGMYLSFPLNIAMVIVGIVHRNDCPVNTRIGWYLVFGGAAGIISVVLKVIMVMAWSCMRKQSEKGLKYDPVAHPALAMVRLPFPYS